jgi:hypothetical protein
MNNNAQLKNWKVIVTLGMLFCRLFDPIHSKTVFHENPNSCTAY